MGSEDWGFLGIRRVRSNLFLGKEVKRGDLRKAKLGKVEARKVSVYFEAWKYFSNLV